MGLTLRRVGLAEGPHPHGSLDSTAKEFGHEGGKSRRGRVAEEGDGGQEEEEAAEAMGMGMKGGHRQ